MCEPPVATAGCQAVAVGILADAGHGEARSIDLESLALLEGDTDTKSGPIYPKLTAFQFCCTMREISKTMS
jgi:hypothetical protein